MKIDISMFGDMAIKDLTPRDANSSGRIIKNLRICGSGLYEYHVSEAPLMGLTVPADYNGDTFKILRSPQVLEANKDLYARVPIITGHHVRVNTANAKQLAVGMVGDTVNTEVGSDGELYLYTTGTIITGDGIAAYNELGQLSVGYDPIVTWEPGTYKGQPYQAVLKGFNEINHLLICKEARGGPQCMIMDSITGSPLEKPEVSKVQNILNGGKTMGIFNKIFGGAKPMTGDAAVVSALLQSISAGADPAVQVAAVRNIMGDAKDDTFTGYLDELAGCKGEDPKVVAKAVNIVDKYYQEHLAGDEKEPPKEPEKKPEPPKDDKKPEAGDTGPTKGAQSCDNPKECGDSDKGEPEKKPENGDSKPQAPEAIDYEKLASMVAAKLKPSMGDEKKPDAYDATAVAQLAVAIGGDSKTDSISSAKVLDEIFG